jgi:hypothetical protein
MLNAKTLAVNFRASPKSQLKRGVAPSILWTDGAKIFGAGSEIQGGVGNELRIVTYVRSRDL